MRQMKSIYGRKFEQIKKRERMEKRKTDGESERGKKRLRQR